MKSGANAAGMEETRSDDEKRGKTPLLLKRSVQTIKALENTTLLKRSVQMTKSAVKHYSY